MAKISVKFKCGDRVQTTYTPPTEGIITAIFIRGKSRAYEMSYTSDSGPTSCTCEEVELRRSQEVDKLGF
ncbi:hypothetical protein LCGC14_1688260 [marine sediment metagenome]|uniref:Uncharacterized protein n=1 Tax=marine sediment metagenome TaxID=412755 RepID=A0A0F9KLP1_9ZZZZ